MSRKKLIPVYRVEDVPHFASDAEAAEFWDTHSVTEEYLADARAHGWIPERPADRLARLRERRPQSG
jgi:hypothetical protein